MQNAICSHGVVGVHPLAGVDVDGAAFALESYRERMLNPSVPDCSAGESSVRHRDAVGRGRAGLVRGVFGDAGGYGDPCFAEVVLGGELSRPSLGALAREDY